MMAFNKVVNMYT